MKYMENYFVPKRLFLRTKIQRMLRLARTNRVFKAYHVLTHIIYFILKWTLSTFRRKLNENKWKTYTVRNSRFVRTRYLTFFRIPLNLSTRLTVTVLRYWFRGFREIKLSKLAQVRWASKRLDGWMLNVDLDGWWSFRSEGRDMKWPEKLSVDNLPRLTELLIELFHENKTYSRFT